MVGELRNKTKLQPSSVWLELELSLAKSGLFSRPFEIFIYSNVYILFVKFNSVAMMFLFDDILKFVMDILYSLLPLLSTPFSCSDAQSFNISNQ